MCKFLSSAEFYISLIFVQGGGVGEGRGRYPQPHIECSTDFSEHRVCCIYPWGGQNFLFRMLIEALRSFPEISFKINKWLSPTPLRSGKTMETRASGYWLLIEPGFPAALGLMRCKLIWVGCDWLVVNFTPVSTVMQTPSFGRGYMPPPSSFSSRYYLLWGVCTHECWKKIKPTVLEIEDKYQARYRWQQVRMTSLMLFWQQCSRLDRYQELPNSFQSPLVSTLPAVWNVTRIGKEVVEKATKSHRGEEKKWATYYKMTAVYLDKQWWEIVVFSHLFCLHQKGPRTSLCRHCTAFIPWMTSASSLWGKRVECFLNTGQTEGADIERRTRKQLAICWKLDYFWNWERLSCGTTALF